MKMWKRMILILLACLMVVGLVACKKDGAAGDSDTSDTTAAAAVADISIFEYNVIRPKQISKKLLGEISTFYGKIMMLSNQSSLYEIDEDKAADAETKEILIGNTNRPETKEALSRISGNEYVVAVVGNKIVIAGLTENTTVMALRYFMQTYLGKDTTGMIAGDLFYTQAADVAMLVEKGVSNYTLVCAKDDYAGVTEQGKLYNTLRVLTKSLVPTAYDDVAYDPNALQILIGYTDYAETKTVADATELEGYTIDFVGNKIVIFGWMTESLSDAVDAFLDLISASIVVDENGDKTLVLLKEKIGSATGNSKFYKDVPFEVSGKACDRIHDGCDDAMVLYWADMKEESLDAYGSSIKALGFTEYQAVNNTSIKAVTYTKDNVTVHVYYLKRTAELRAVVYYDLGLAIKASAYTKVCEPAVTQLSVDPGTNGKGSGMSYLIRLEDGTFIVIDGGDDKAGNADNIYNTMLAQKPAAVEKPVIAAWIISHPHPDHIGGIKSMAKSAHKDDVTVKTLIASCPPRYEYFLQDNSASVHDDSYYKAASALFPNCQYIKAMAGQQYFFPGVTVDMLYSPIDPYPEFIFEQNGGSCLTFRLTVNKSDTHEKQTFIFLGDVTDVGADRIVEMYGEDLKADVVQIGHHGNKGGSQKFYELVDADLAFLPNSQRIWEGGGYKKYPWTVWVLENTETVVQAWHGNYTIRYGADANS